MFREKCSPHQENIPAYSLGALDADEIVVFESHLATCDECQAELKDYQNIADGLLLAVPPRMPSKSLRSKLLKQLSPGQKQTISPSAQFGRLFPTTQFVGTLVLLILFVGNLFSILQINALQKQQNALLERLSTEQEAIALLAYPNTQVEVVNANIQDLTGSVLLDKDTNTAVIFLWNLPELTDDQIYQIWLIDPSGNRISGGLFSSNSLLEYTTAFVQSPVELKTFVRIGVTVEPQGGSDEPTSSPVLFVDL